jgi:dolichol-phosphate mannosyltransferase
MKVSVVLPTYNEKDNIKVLIPQLEQLFKKSKIDAQIVVVDDSSPDGTYKVARNLNKKYKNIKVLVREKKEGIGAALRYAYDRSDGEILISMDADLCLDIEEIPNFIKKIENGYDLVVGSRFLKSGSYEKKKMKTRMKNLFSTAGNRLIVFLLGLGVHDFSLDFRAIRKSVWKSIETKEKRNAFLLEMIVKAKSMGYRVGEIPVAFKDRKYGESKMKLSSEIINFLKTLLKYFVSYRLLPRK